MKQKVFELVIFHKMKSQWFPVVLSAVFIVKLLKDHFYFRYKTHMFTCVGKAKKMDLKNK
jgi:hypothetical protein